MKIIERGTPPLKPKPKKPTSPHRFTCTKCWTVAAARPGDVVGRSTCGEAMPWPFPDKIEEFVEFCCPVCGNAQHIQLRMFNEQWQAWILGPDLWPT